MTNAPCPARLRRSAPHRYRIRAGIALLLLLINANVASAQGERRKITLTPGEQTTIPGVGIDKISVGAEGIVDVRVTNNQSEVLLVAIAPGNTTLLVLMLDGRKIRYEISVSSIRARRNIRLDFYFVQVSHNENLRLGVAWPGTLGASIDAQINASKSGETNNFQATASVVTQILPRLDFAQDAGWAKILQHMRIVMANGEQGQYASGGETNFRVVNGLSASVQTISFGTTVQAKATYDRVTGRLDVKISAEVSRLTASAGADVPGRAVAKLETTVNLALGQSIALAGLFGDESSRTASGLPFLSKLPVFGYFFGTKRHLDSHTQNVVFIVPSLVSAISMEERNRVREALQLYRNYGGENINLADGIGNDNQLNEVPLAPSSRSRRLPTSRETRKNTPKSQKNPRRSRRR